MTPLIRRILITLAILALPRLAVIAQEPTASDGGSVAPDSVISGPSRGEGLIKRIVRYFSEANVPRENGKFDISFIGGPYYSSDIGLGLGMVASGEYGYAAVDTVNHTRIHPTIGIFLNVSTTGFVAFGVEGMHVTKSDRLRINYRLGFENYPKKFWGIGYESAKQKDNWTKFDEISLKLLMNFGFRMGYNLFLGPSVDFSWINAKNVKKMRSLWDGQSEHIVSLGVGGVLSYDTRDNLTAPHRGLYISAEMRIYPSFLGNGTHHFFLAEGSINKYFGIWKGGILALRYQAAISWGKTPWCMLPTFGGSHDMRGYYEGRYRDKNEMNAQAELRQNIWHRCGVAIWCGAGTVFSRASDLSIRKVLPNFGIGYRWEFKKNSNVRVDFGIGRGETGFIFNINEAF